MHTRGDTFTPRCNPIRCKRYSRAYEENDFAKKINCQLVSSTFKGLAYVNELADDAAKKAYKKESKKHKKVSSAFALTSASTRLHASMGQVDITVVKLHVITLTGFQISLNCLKNSMPNSLPIAPGLILEGKGVGGAIGFDLPCTRTYR